MEERETFLPPEQMKKQQMALTQQQTQVLMRTVLFKVELPMDSPRPHKPMVPTSKREPFEEEPFEGVVESVPFDWGLDLVRHPEGGHFEDEGLLAHVLVRVLEGLRGLDLVDDDLLGEFQVHDEGEIREEVPEDQESHDEIHEESPGSETNPTTEFNASFKSTRHQSIVSV